MRDPFITLASRSLDRSFTYNSETFLGRLSLIFCLLNQYFPIVYLPKFLQTFYHTFHLKNMANIKKIGFYENLWFRGFFSGEGSTLEITTYKCLLLYKFVWIACISRFHQLHKNHRVSLLVNYLFSPKRITFFILHQISSCILFIFLCSKLFVLSEAFLWGHILPEPSGRVDYSPVWVCL